MAKGGTGILVGFDGSKESALALDWAIATAQRDGHELILVHSLPVEVNSSFDPVTEWLPLGPGTAPWLEADGLAPAVTALGDDRVRVVRVVGPPSAHLVELSREAHLVVTGTRGRGALAAGVLGSTAYAVAAHAHCPVVIVRGSQPAGHALQSGPDHPVLVGVDDVEHTGAALDAAADEAVKSGAELRIVRVVHFEPWAWAYAESKDAEQLYLSALEREATEILREAQERVQARQVGLNVTTAILRGNQGHALADEARDIDAGLVVVGSRGRGGFAGLALGSVSHAVIHFMARPVMVVRSEVSG
ncbi:MAG: universal stress protein [Tetrasphaera sp.]